jgi:hypothetical protein
MDVIGFLCVSLGSSTVQLHDSLGSRHTCAQSEAGFSSRGVCTTEEQRSLVRLLWANGLSAKHIDKEMVPVYGWKYLSRKAVHN